MMSITINPRALDEAELAELARRLDAAARIARAELAERQRAREREAAWQARLRERRRLLEEKAHGRRLRIAAAMLRGVPPATIAASEGISVRTLYRERAQALALASTLDRAQQHKRREAQAGEDQQRAGSPRSEARE